VLDGNDSTERSVAESIAESISQGERIEWDQVERQSTDEQETGVLRELHLVDRIAAFHRRPESSRPTDPSGMIWGVAKPDDNILTWAHLRIIEKIGEGVFGTVYRARDAKLQSDVALKLMWPDAPGSPSSPSRALKEARLLARIRHANVVRVYGADLIDGRVGLWMEFIKGRTLANLLSTQGPFSAREAALIGLDLCRALAAVHRARLIHGDIKAHNVMREEGGRTVLMDFGTGKDLARTRRDRAVIDDFAGTPLYLPPEVFDGQPRSKTTDIYSLGVLLFHLVTDAYPAEGRTREEVKHAHEQKQRKHLRDIRPDLPEEFVHPVERALAVDSRDRYQSAGAFEIALAGFLGQTPAPEPTWLSFHSRMVQAVFALALVVALGIGYRVFAPGPAATARSAASPVVPLNETKPPVVEAPLARSPSYQIDTAVFRASGDGQEVRLRSGARVAPSDRLFVEVRTSVPAHVYIVNEDERGASYLLFPMPGLDATNPLPAGKTNRLPGIRQNEEVYWQVDKVGGREHFLIFASPERLAAFERSLASLPHPEIGKPIQSLPLSKEAVTTLRSVGGLATVAPNASTQSAGPLTQQYRTPLENGEATANGLWVRQLTLENPQ
jgi:eukaryotic-like serine/threonine-protein kinase